VKKALTLVGFALAMGYLEAAVVVYLRQIYFPQGFAFPLNSTMLEPTLLVEWGRETATLVMLAVIAWLSGRSLLERSSWFLFVFGVWDIFYYLGLKAILGWPPSLLTWDILLLIPIPWVAPVLAPVLVAALMIALGLGFINLGRTGRVVRGNPVDWLAMAIGATAILLSFLSSYGLVVARRGLPYNPLGLHPELRADFAAHIPTNYPWWLLAFGLAVVVWAAFFRIYSRSLESGPTSEGNRRSP
jgi:hypothetical protein